MLEKVTKITKAVDDAVIYKGRLITLNEKYDAAAKPTLQGELADGRKVDLDVPGLTEAAQKHFEGLIDADIAATSGLFSSVGAMLDEEPGTVPMKAQA